MVGGYGRIRGWTGYNCMLEEEVGRRAQETVRESEREEAGSLKLVPGPRFDARIGKVLISRL